MTETSASGVGALGASLLALLAVVALILLLGWLLRRLPGLSMRQSGELRMVASLSVGVRERVMVIAAGSQQLVIGVTAERITLLHTLDTPIAESSPVEFRHWLSKAKNARPE